MMANCGEASRQVGRRHAIERQSDVNRASALRVIVYPRRLKGISNMNDRHKSGGHGCARSQVTSGANVVSGEDIVEWRSDVRVSGARRAAGGAGAVVTKPAVRHATLLLSRFMPSIRSGATDQAPNGRFGIRGR